MLALFKILLVNPLFELFRSSNLGREQIHGDETRGVFVFHAMFDRRKIIALLLYDDFKHSPSVPIPSRPPCASARRKKSLDVCSSNFFLNACNINFALFARQSITGEEGKRRESDSFVVFPRLVSFFVVLLEFCFHWLKFRYQSDILVGKWTKIGEYLENEANNVKFLLSS